MTVNLIESIQKNLQYPALKKIDPNIQEVKDKGVQSTVDQIAQAAIPAVLTGLYKLSRNDEGSSRILTTAEVEDSLAALFNGKENILVEKVALYAGISDNQAESHLENIADESIKLVKEVMGENGTPKKLKQFMNDQRHNILVYLPAALGLGDLLKDETLDDPTNKMEGPVSNFMHKIEDKLSQGGS
jgi:hypothetical protein